MILHPGTFMALSRVLYTLGMMDKGLIRFAERQMNTQEKREQVYYSWVVFRHLRFDLKSMASLVNAHCIPLTLFVGKYDKVIRPENMNRLLNYLNHYRFEVLDSGHNTIIRESLAHWKASEEVAS
jgi:pimeloyl-ACP methyl ester carboxylesterase